MLDDLLTFAERFPTWVGTDGLPLSYRHYVYGSAHLGRADVWRMLRDAQAFHSAASSDYENWRKDMLRLVR